MKHIVILPSYSFSQNQGNKFQVMVNIGKEKTALSTYVFLYKETIK